MDEKETSVRRKVEIKSEQYLGNYLTKYYYSANMTQTYYDVLCR